MNAEVGAARIGQWYTRRDKGESFQITGLDGRAKTIEIQTFDGDVDEIEAEDWRNLPLGLAEPPEDWTGAIDDSQVDDRGYDEAGMMAQEWNRPLDPLGTVQATDEAWDEIVDFEDRDESERDLSDRARAS